MAGERPAGCIGFPHQEERLVNRFLLRDAKTGSCRRRRERYLSPPNGFIVVLSLCSAGRSIPEARSLSVLS